MIEHILLYVFLFVTSMNNFCQWFKSNNLLIRIHAL